MAKTQGLMAYMNGECPDWTDFSTAELKEMDMTRKDIEATFINWEKIDDGHIRLDYMCAFCNEVHEVIEEIRADYEYIADCPYDEEPYKLYPSQVVCQAFRLQLRNTFGKEPKGAELQIRHEQGGGGYFTVVCSWDGENPLARAYAMMLEGNVPANWSPAAKKFLEDWRNKRLIAA